MIIASDLDRTLIYSKRAIEDLDGPLLDIKALKAVEEKDGKWVSYMTLPSFNALKTLGKEYCFVPVTTRTTEQFKRIAIFHEDIPVRYAVTSNGANILYKGLPDKEWKMRIASELEHSAMDQSELFKYLEKEGHLFKGKLKIAESLFFYYILQERISTTEKNMINGIVSALGWRVSQQGKKLYFIPKCISKGTAIQFISEREGTETFAGAGDSILDLDFLQHCTHRFVPGHGELAAEEILSGYHITKNRGVRAGEEILSTLISLLPLNV